MRWAIAALASSFEDQVSLYPPGYDIVTDLVDEFDMAILEMSRSGYLIPGAIDNISKLLDQLEPHDPTWSKEALEKSEFWEAMRATARRTQKECGYPFEKPEANPATFVLKRT